MRNYHAPCMKAPLKEHFTSANSVAGFFEVTFAGYVENLGPQEKQIRLSGSFPYLSTLEREN